MNIAFEYLYRDAGNYKKWDTIVFSNSENISAEFATQQIIENCDEALYFKAEDIQVPDLHFEESDPELDHVWHEFHYCSQTAEPITDVLNRDIKVIIAQFVLARKNRVDEKVSASNVSRVHA